MSMSLMSPAELDADPRRWLDVPHDLHEDLLKLMDTVLFPGFKQKLIDNKIHCLKCEGFNPQLGITVDSKPVIVVGYIGDDFFNAELWHTRKLSDKEDA